MLTSGIIKFRNYDGRDLFRKYAYVSVMNFNRGLAYESNELSDNDLGLS